MKPIFCLIMMLTITPLAAAFGLASYDTLIWGGEIKILNILGLAIFGLISRQFWLTFIPSLIFTPIIMKHLSNKEIFYAIPLWKFYANSILYGVFAGIFIVLPAILIATTKSIDAGLMWVWSGVVAGGITFPIISTLYRLTGPKDLKGKA